MPPRKTGMKLEEVVRRFKVTGSAARPLILKLNIVGRKGCFILKEIEKRKVAIRRY